MGDRRETMGGVRVRAQEKVQTGAIESARQLHALTWALE